MKNKAPIIILRASKQPYLSIGVRFGGVKAFNAEYKYFLNNDVFVRKDYASKYNQHLKQGNSFRSFVELVKSIEND